MRNSILVALGATLTTLLVAPGAGAQTPQQVLAPAAASTSVGAVEGRVVGAARGEPLADIVVRVEGTTRGAVTDADGRYAIHGVPAGQYAVSATRLGLAPERRTIAVAAGATDTVDFRLREAAIVIPPVIVSATREAQRRAEASATIDVLDGAEIRQTRASHPAGIMNRIPGVHVSDLSGEGHSMAMRQPITTKPMYLYLEDGVPTRATGFFNHNALYEVNIPQSGGLEVLKGPGTALYGSDAIGGVVNVLTRPAPVTPTAEVTMEGGAYGYGRVLATGGFTRAGQGVRADLNVTHSDNWKDDAPFNRQSATVRWDAFDVRGWSAKTVITGSNIDQTDVATLNQAQYDGGLNSRSLNRSPIAYRTVKALRVSTALDRERGATLWSFTPFARYNDMGLLPYWQLTFDPQTWDTRNTSLGMLAKYRRDFAPLRARVIAGADMDLSPGSFEARKAVTAAEGANRVYAKYTDGDVQYDYDVTYRALSPYVHTEISPLARLRVDAGLRYDATGYVYRTNLTPVDTGAHRRPADTDVSYRHLSPKLGATYELSSSLSAFGSYRHGFRAPSQGQLFQQNSAANTVGLDPVKVDAFEAGLRGQLLGQRALYQLSAYDMTIRDDIITFITPANTRVATNAGRTRHRGVEAALGAAVLPRLRVDASWSRTWQTYEQWDPSPTTSYDGKLIEQAPRALGNLLVTWTPRALKGGRLAAEWSHTGLYVTDPSNQHRYGGHDLLNLHANANLMPSVELFARAVNVANTRYAELVAYDAFQKEQYTPGAPRTLYAGVRYAWQK